MNKAGAPTKLGVDAALSMQGIADLARVQRPVVSMWRSRFQASDRPFPDPLQVHPLLFDAEEVATWLEETGRGNNAEVWAETPLHSSVAEIALGDLPTISALLLLSELSGELPENLDLPAALSLLESAQLGAVLTAEDAASALRDTHATYLAGSLVEAAFSGEAALRHLLQMHLKSYMGRDLELLTGEAYSFLGAILAEVHLATPQVVVPLGLGAALLADAASQASPECEPVQFKMPAGFGAGNRPRSDEELAVWRLLAARGLATTTTEPNELAPPTTYLFSWAGATDAADFFGKLEDLVQVLGVNDQLFVIGPAQFMVEEQGARDRRSFLVPDPRYTERLRYTATLPGGMCRFQPRKRLALWAFGAPDSTWTVSASHGQEPLDGPTASLVAADIAASLSGAQATVRHAFLNSSIRGSAQFLSAENLSLPPNPVRAIPGGDRLARIWELDPGDSVGIRFVAEDGGADRVDFDTAARMLGADRCGARIPGHALGFAAAGSALVIGKPELRGETKVGNRSIDRLTLEKVAPQARLTDPGDVVYLPQDRPVALVDAVGGSVVEAPARIFRCDADPDGDRVLSPHIVALDIAGSRGRDRTKWQLRAISRGDVAVAQTVATALDQKRQELEAALGALGDLKNEILEGLGDRTLSGITQTGNDEGRSILG